MGWTTCRAVPALVAIAVVAAAAAAAPEEGDVDRDALRRAVTLPAVGPRGWYYTVADDGSVHEGGAERPDVAALAAAAEADASNAERWTDLAAAYRRAEDAARALECVERAVSLLREQTAAKPDDGRTLASLGLALVAAGREADGEEVLRRAAAAPRDGWAGQAAAGDLLLMRAAGKLAGRSFASTIEATGWLARDEDRVRGLDGALLDAAEERYGSAAAGVEAAGVGGPAAASVYVRRRRILIARLTQLAPDADPAAAGALRSRADSDHRLALAALPTDPYAVTMLALDDAMPPDGDGDGVRHVQAMAHLSESARAKVAAGVARLLKLAESADARTAARAHEGVACIRWFVGRDGAAAEASLRQALAKDASLRQPWDALTVVLASDDRWDDVARLCESWIERGDTAEKRMRLATAHAMGGRGGDAEREWRAALALEPQGVEANVGVAAFVLRRAKDDADLAEATGLLRTARAGLAASGREPAHVRRLECQCDLTEAVALGLAGDADGAEKIARGLIEKAGDVPSVLRVLRALGR